MGLRYGKGEGDADEEGGGGGEDASIWSQTGRAWYLRGWKR